MREPTKLIERRSLITKKKKTKQLVFMVADKPLLHSDITSRVALIILRKGAFPRMHRRAVCIFFRWKRSMRCHARGILQT